MVDHDSSQANACPPKVGFPMLRCNPTGSLAAKRYLPLPLPPKSRLAQGQVGGPLLFLQHLRPTTDTILHYYYHHHYNEPFYLFTRLSLLPCTGPSLHKKPTSLLAVFVVATNILLLCRLPPLFSLLALPPQSTWFPHPIQSLGLFSPVATPCSFRV